MRTFLLILFCLNFPASTFTQVNEFNVMSFNIRYPNPDDGVNYWDNRKDLVVSTIRYYEADLIGVQEAFRRQLDELMEALPNYAWVGVCRTDGTLHPEPDNEFSAILYRKDRFELLEDDTFWLSETPNTVSTAWDAALPRIATWAKFKDRRSERICYHFNTHFDHRGDTARVESAKLILNKIAEITKNQAVVLTGDFNANTTSLPYRTLVDEKNDQHLIDALTISKLPHHGPLGTWSNFKFPGVPDRRIDYIFVNNKINVKKHANLSDSWSGRFPSDHLPVLATIAIEK